MTQTAAVDYASPTPSICSLCRTRPTKKKTIYGYPVCKKCFYRFTNRRQLGYLCDVILITIIQYGASMLFMLMLRQIAVGTSGVLLIPYGLGAVLKLLYVMKDGFAGQSPGKWLADTQVLDQTTHLPIGFKQSLKRYWFVLLGIVPLLGQLASGVMLVIIIFQVGRGFRLFDHYANTRVIWKRYADSPVFGGDALQCEQCGYNLVGNLSGVCPECGLAVSAQNQARLTLVQPAVPIEA